MTVTKPDGPPTPVGTVPDQKLKVGGSSIVVDTTNYFAEIPAAVGRAYSVQSSDSGIVKAEGSGGSGYTGAISVTLTPVAAGSATITVTVTDAQGSGSQSFTTTAYDGPAAVGTIPNVTFTSNGSTSDVDLSPYFGAFDMSDLTWTVVSSNTAKATVSLSGTTVTVTSVAAGTSTITARAMDSASKFATQTFTVTVKGPPVPVGTIPNQTLEVGGAAVTINVSGYFTDPDGGTLTYSSILYGAVRITFRLSGSILTITPPQNAPTGSGTLRIRATDPDGLSAKQEFTVTLVLGNRAPVASGTISDITTRVGRSATDVDLSPYFTDADGDTLTYSVVSSDTAKATASLSNTTLTVTPVAQGTATITATATDPDGAFATQTFTMTVQQANRAPVASQTIPNYTINRSDASAIPNVALGDYFSDPDGDWLTYTATTPVGSHIVWPHFGSGASTLTLAPTDPASVINSGTVTVTVTATDGDNASVTQSFSVTTSRQPTAVGTISDQYLLSHHVVVQNIASYFNDGDGDTLTYSVSPANTTAVNATVATAETGPAVIFSKAGGQGSVIATITATDPTGFDSDTDLNGIRRATTDDCRDNS